MSNAKLKFWQGMCMSWSNHVVLVNNTAVIASLCKFFWKLCNYLSVLCVAIGFTSTNRNLPLTCVKYIY